MSFLSNAQFLYLMGVIWLINGSVSVIAVFLAKELNERNFMFKCCVTSWLIGIGHVIYAFML